MKYASNVDLTRFKGPVLDQGSIGSCAENALAEMVYATMRQAGMPAYTISRLQSYYDTREAQGNINVDNGTHVPTMFAQAMQKGLAHESLWQYNTAMMYTKPTEVTYADAALHKVMYWSEISPYQAYDSLAVSIKAKLAEGKPVLLAFKAGSSFFSQSGPLATQTNTWDAAEDGVGHGVVIERCDDALNGGSYIVKNSWGASWGDNGYGTISYKQFMPHTYDFLGAYTVDGFNNVDFRYTAERAKAAWLYVSVLDRAVEASGVNYWAGVFAAGTSFTHAAQGMFQSAEARTIFPANSTNAELVDKMYLVILGRHADPSGLAYWSNFLSSGYSPGDVINSLVSFVTSYAGADPGALQEHDRFMNRASVALYYGVSSQADDYHYTAAVEALQAVTYDPATAEAAKVGISYDLGYL